MDGRKSRNGCSGSLFNITACSIYTFYNCIQSSSPRKRKILLKTIYDSKYFQESDTQAEKQTKCSRSSAAGC